MNSAKSHNRVNIRIIACLVVIALTSLAATFCLTGCQHKSRGTTPLPGSIAPAFNEESGSAVQTPAPRRPADIGPSAPPRAHQVPGSLPSLDEEVWVIARSRGESSPSKDPMPGGGSLVTSLDKKQIPLPLKHTSVKASVDGYIATVRVVQQFHNPYDGKIEAVYVFPLPENAAVNDFIMTIGERRIRGIIRERKEAEKIYREAKRQGYVASLLTQERPNLFTQSVANIEPGKQIDVDITYFHTLAYVDGWYEFVYPMVVGPRFNPPGSTDGVGAIARGRHGASGQKTQVQYLRPTERSGHDISLALEIHAGVTLEEISCRSHRITKSERAPAVTAIALSPQDTIPNKDFVLRYRVAGERIKSNLLTHRDERGGYFTFMLYPPQELQKLTRAPLELVFVLDCSGSMSGKPIEQAKAAVEHALKRLQPTDSFQLINFSESASQLGPTPLGATSTNVQRGLHYLQALQGDGPTMMIEGIKAALDFPHDPERLRFVCFLTDGYIGNETEILRAVERHLGDARIFSFGVGSAPNRYLLDGLAKLGRGAVAHLALTDSGAQVMDDFFERISHPALTDVQLDWGGLEVTEVFPTRIPDLFVGRPVVLTGRFQGEGAKTIRVMGRAGQKPIELPVTVNLNERDVAGSALPSVWARLKIAALADQFICVGDSALPGQIRQVALDYSLMSAFTAFVAVDSSTRTAGPSGTTVPVPVAVPEGVKYETTVEE